MGSSKWIGGVLGAIFGGPVGAVAGFGIGCLVDRFVARLDDAEDDQPPLRTRSSTGARPGRGAAESRRESAAPRPQADEFSICICVLIAGVIGYFFLEIGIPQSPLVLSLLLGYDLEKYFRPAIIMGGGKWSVFLTRKLSLGIVIFGLLFISVPIVVNILKKRRTIREKK